MQEGLHEYNQRRRLLNLEKRKKKGIIVPKLEKRKDKNAEMSEEEDQVSRVGLFDPEERKRFYKILFDEDP